jgi:hypothetical protein
LAIAELSIIHDPTYRGISVRRNLDEIKTRSGSLS